MDRRVVMLGAMGAMLAGMAEAKIRWKLGEADAQAGLREVLGNGTIAAVARVGQPGGYWDDKAIRIPLPSKLATVQRALKPIGMGALLDDLHLRMNRAAELAAPVASDLFTASIKSMSIKDAVSIVKGGPTSGTDYLRKTTTPALTSAFTPPIRSAMQASGAVDYLDRAVKRNNLQSLMKTDAKTYLGTYATGLALDGLFHYIGIEEASIRRDPLKRTSQLLKNVFG